MSEKTDTEAQNFYYGSSVSNPNTCLKSKKSQTSITAYSALKSYLHTQTLFSFTGMIFT